MRLLKQRFGPVAPAVKFVVRGLPAGKRHNVLVFKGLFERHAHCLPCDVEQRRVRVVRIPLNSLREFSENILLLAHEGDL